jgi:sugar-specific transcriptional regulator TrmB
MDSEKKGIMREYLSSLGVPAEAAEIYIVLKTEGQMGLSELSRRSGIERTKLYRIIDELKKTHLFEVEVINKRKLFSAASLNNLKILIQQKIDQADVLSDKFNLVRNLFEDRELQAGSTGVRVYSGAEGIRQVQWNQLHAKSPQLLSLMKDPINTVVGLSFFNSWAGELNKRSLSLRFLYSKRFDQQDKAWYQEHASEDITRISNLKKKLISEDKLEISVNCDIWDDTVVYYNWDDPKNIYAIEIRSKELAHQQRQFFEILWASVEDQDL